MCVWKIIIIQGIKIGKTRRKRVKIRSPCCLLAVFVRPPAAGLGGDVVGHVDGGGHELVPRLRGVVVVVVLAAGEAEPRALYMLAPATRHTTSVLGLREANLHGHMDMDMKQVKYDNLEAERFIQISLFLSSGHSMLALAGWWTKSQVINRQSFIIKIFAMKKIFRRN